MCALILARMRRESNGTYRGHGGFSRRRRASRRLSCVPDGSLRIRAQFLQLAPTHTLINNIDDDHLDCYKDIDEIFAAFKEYAALLPLSGLLFANGMIRLSCGLRPNPAGKP